MALPAAVLVLTCFSSVAVIFDCLWPHRLQHTTLLCPPLPPRVCSNSCPLSHWCYLTTSSSVATFSFCLQSFPESGSFPVGSLHHVAKVLELQLQHQSFLLMNIQGWFPLELTGLISLLCPRDSQESSPAPQFESINSSVLNLLYGPTSTWLLEKP